MKPTGWVVDMRHYLDEETGDLPDGLPTPVLNLALFFGSIVAWVTDHLPHGDWHTNVPCRRSPSRRRCLRRAIDADRRRRGRARRCGASLSIDASVLKRSVRAPM